MANLKLYMPTSRLRGRGPCSVKASDPCGSVRAPARYPHSRTRHHFHMHFLAVSETTSVSQLTSWPLPVDHVLSSSVLFCSLLLVCPLYTLIQHLSVPAARTTRPALRPYQTSTRPVSRLFDLIRRHGQVPEPCSASIAPRVDRASRRGCSQAMSAPRFWRRHHL
jgi:hypothetical protein